MTKVITEEQRIKRRKWSRDSYFRNRDKYLERDRQYRLDHPGEEYERKKKYHKQHPEKYLLRSAKKRMKNLGINLSITEEDIIIPEYCPILNVKLESVCNGPEEKDFSPSLDRIDNSKGYIPGNVAVISNRANRLKSALGLKDIERLYQYIKRVIHE